jgi:hypothetical protein
MNTSLCLVDSGSGEITSIAVGADSLGAGDISMCEQAKHNTSKRKIAFIGLPLVMMNHDDPPTPTGFKDASSQELIFSVM